MTHRHSSTTADFIPAQIKNLYKIIDPCLKKNIFMNKY